MVLTFIRCLFVIIVVSIGMSYAEVTYGQTQYSPLMVLAVSLGGAILVIVVDALAPHRSLMQLSGLFFGLVMGLLGTYALWVVGETVVESFYPAAPPALMSTIKLLLGVLVCYITVTVVIRTKDDVRFVIPYVEFSKQVKGSRPLLLDTSVIIDGRVADVVDTHFLESELVVPRFVLHELQALADSNDRQKRTRARRGLDVLSRLQRSTATEVSIYDGEVPALVANEGVDQKLVALAIQMSGRIMTTDYNLAKIAQLRGVTVLNINDLVNALKPAVIAGEKMTVRVIKPGEEPGQGVGYLDDGTMVVVDGARERIGETVEFFVSSVLQTSAGKMIFGRLEGVEPERRRRATRQS